ncbi:MAG: hypothetical protein QW587_07140 [Candidatus Bathyarchaeia archaeon]
MVQAASKPSFSGFNPYWDMAAKDGFQVYSIEEAAQRGDVVLLLFPDEVQRHVYEVSVEKTLAPGKALVFAHGYNIHYGFIRPPAFVDVLMLAPRMIGEAVRGSTFAEAEPPPSWPSIKMPRGRRKAS